MSKEELKVAIKELAEEIGVTLPKSWQNKSEENLAIMLEDLKDTEVVEEDEITVKEKTMSIIDLKAENKSFLKQLQAEEYVDIEIEPNSIYPAGSTVPIGLNGVVIRVPVGMYFEKGVPKSIADVYRYSKNETRKGNAALTKKLTGEIKVQ